MYLSDKPNYPLLQTLLDSLHQDLRLLMDPPDGSKEHPATTCLELRLCHPDYTSGMYYIDPNQGSTADALLAYCNFSGTAAHTCLHPRDAQMPTKAWLMDSETDSSFQWLSKQEQGFQFYYPGANVVQMRFLRLQSWRALQKITYTCHPGHRLGHTAREVKFLTDTRRQSYLGALNDCIPGDEVDSLEPREFVLWQPGDEVDSLEPREFVFEFEDLNLLPVRDVAVFGGGNVTREFGFTIGPVCFS
ncbi:collagen alpha-2(V) chain-like [Oncorhynchus nerka]|uniref:collagen alpha-2(V) chain-like n=1 Tax=Oncorhynchus nerka TaxID=8023 RepID=UPI0031B8A462